MLPQSDFSQRIYPLYSHILLSFSILPNENALVAKGREKSVTYTALPPACLPPSLPLALSPLIGLERKHLAISLPLSPH